MKPWIGLIGLVFPMVTFGTKPTVPLEPQTKFAQYVFVAKVVRGCTLCDSPKFVEAKVTEILKSKEPFDLPLTVSFTAPGLSFDAGKRYVLFLYKSGNAWRWVTGNSTRPLATKPTIEKVRQIVKDQS